MKWLIVVAALAACKKSSSSSNDCDVVSKDPANAMAELSKRYPNNGVKVAETIEKCIAPTGDECTRVAAMVKAIPSMAPGLSAPKTGSDYADICRTSPPELRKCFLPSYALAHADECAKLRDKLVEQVNIKPAAPGGGCDGGSVVIYVTREGTWMATGKDAASRCYGARKGTDLDTGWLEGELRSLKSLPCPPSIELASAAEVLYKDVIQTMDTAMKAGLPNIGLASADKLSVSLADAKADKAAAHCPATAIPSAPGASAPPARDTAAPAPPGSDPGTLAGAPVVAITQHEITVNGKMVMTMKMATDSSGPLVEIANELPASTKDGVVIVQADQSTPSDVITRLVRTANEAGYSKPLFAVKNR